MLQDIDLQYIGGVPTFGGPVAATAVGATGLTGATAQSRYVGAIASGTAPASGTFLAGDWMVVQSGGIIVCSAGGTQGTWVSITALDTTATDIQPDGAQAAGSTSKAADAGHVHPSLDAALPSDYGMLAWNFDPATLNTSTAMVSETLYLLGLFIRRPVTVAKVWLAIGAQGTGSVTAAGIGLYNSAGTLLGSSASTAWATAVAGPDSVALTVQSGQSLSITAGLYWVGLFAEQASAVVNLRGIASGTSNPNMNLTAATYRFATNGTAVTSLPTTVTPSANSETGVIPFFAGLG